MFFECKRCGFFSNNSKDHVCISENQLKIERFKRCLKNINIILKKNMNDT